jgi:hypothetical protein
MPKFAKLLIDKQTDNHAWVNLDAVERISEGSTGRVTLHMSGSAAQLETCATMSDLQNAAVEAIEL